MGNLSNWGRLRLREDSGSLGSHSWPCLSPSFPCIQLSWPGVAAYPSGPTRDSLANSCSGLGSPEVGPAGWKLPLALSSSVLCFAFIPFCICVVLVMEPRILDKPGNPSTSKP